MFRILLLLVMVMMTTTQAKAINRLFYKSNFYGGDPNITKFVIDEDFSEPFREVIIKRIKERFKVTEIKFKQVGERYREPFTLVFTKNNVLGATNGYFSPGGNGYTTTINGSKTFFSTRPNIFIPEEDYILVHELAHYFFLDHENDKARWTLVRTKFFFKDFKLYKSPLGLSQSISYGSSALKAGFEDVLPSDQFSIDVINEEAGYIKITSNDLLEYDGADLYIEDCNYKVPVIKNYKTKTAKDGYLTAIGLGYLGKGAVETYIPYKQGIYKVYLNPSNPRNLNVPNSTDSSGLEKPIQIGTIKVNKKLNVKFSKQLKELGFEAKYFQPINRQALFLKKQSKVEEHLPGMEGVIVE